jgi:hypothetical protein
LSICSSSHATSTGCFLLHISHAHQPQQLVGLTVTCSYWISLAGAGQLPLWLLDARSKIKSAMTKALYGEVQHR